MEFREQITIGFVFFVFAYFLSLGFWQVLGTYRGIRAFSLLPGGAQRRWGYLLGSVIMTAASVWFFGTRTEDISSPGPASSEFLFFLSVALLCALVTCLIVSSAEDGLSAAWGRARRGGGCRREAVSTKWWQGSLYLPAANGGRWPVVCAAPERGKSVQALNSLASELVRRGLAVLVMDLRSGELWRYPDVLAVPPQGVAFAEGRADLDAGRLGLLGIGLGADLAIRAAASDHKTRAVMAVSPLLDRSRVEPGLHLLRDMSYLEAVRWRRVNGEGNLVSRLDALGLLSQLQPRPLLVLSGERDRMLHELVKSALLPRDKSATVAGMGRVGLAEHARGISVIANWFAERL